MRYVAIDPNTQALTEYVPAIHGLLPEHGPLPAHLRALADDHWFWHPLPPGKSIRITAGELQLVDDIDSRSLDELRESALSSLNHAADAALAPILSLYPAAEVASWPEQLAEADAWLSDPTAHTPLLDAIVGAGDKAALCESILTKAHAYKQACGAVIAWRRAVTEWIDAQDDAGLLAGWKPQFPEVPT